MKIASKYLLIQRDIDKVKNDLIQLTGKNRYVDGKDKIFYGEINNKTFKLQNKNRETITWRLPLPEFTGILIDNNGKTLMKIDINITFTDKHIMNINIFIIFFCIIGFIYTIFNLYITNRVNEIGWAFGLLIIPIYFIFIFVFQLKFMINRIENFAEGKYDKYIKEEKLHNGT